VRDDGYIFTGSQWMSPEAHRKRPLTACVVNARKRAQAQGVPFDLTLDYVDHLLQQSPTCPVLGISLVQGLTGGRDCSPSLDRIVPELGYVQGNVKFISNAANRVKGSLTVDQVERMLTYMKGMH
jgi:hypothetical protein